ncbi:DoxX family protein [Sinomicrobium weinanense]|uniref:DoxX family protein n=1 Tax=Sinomicrobium weinanense TaxID=2842200 RepID=A0A926JVB9_9FLAO|nr:DoxX family protein [Sinomicrobium weinanense]MBC9798253.1 DoxX family protein [Sinomicrobium weinanense]MBU3122642.1 DoxX family protein [Sinomicrobium weinanense]
MKQNNKVEKCRKIAYWITTGLLSFGMLSGGIAQLLRLQGTADGILNLGYPSYFMSILGTWKIIGVTVLLLPRFRLFKEWAYAGFFFAMTGAVFSHLANSEGIGEITAPALFAVLAVLSWRLRPSNRKIPYINSSVKVSSGKSL